MVFISISWKSFVKLLLKEWYAILSQKWSHIKLKHTLNDHVIIIPNHKELKEWLFNGILSQISKNLWETKLQLYNKLFK